MDDSSQFFHSATLQNAKERRKKKKQHNSKSGPTSESTSITFLFLIREVEIVPTILQGESE